MNCSLWNASGDEFDTMYRDFDYPARQTKYGRQLPYIDSIIRENFTFNYLKMVRMRSLIDGIVIPHKDFVEVGEHIPQCFRVFIALEDNEEAFHSDEQAVFRMRKGEIWFLDAAIVHAAANFSNKSRVHLCLDYIFPEKFSPADIFVNPNLYTPELAPLIISREKPPSNFEESLILTFTKTISKHNMKDIVSLLSKMHFYMQVPVGACYDWLVEIARRSGDSAILKKAEHLRTYLIIDRKLGERFSLAEW